VAALLGAGLHLGQQDLPPTLARRLVPAALRALAAKPLVAIGGITLETAPLVLESGADSVAVIGALIPDTLTPQTITERMREWLKATS
jgi:thiamine monophosphate synthase